MPASRSEATRPEDAMRGVAGAFLLGVPLVYTQEVWFHGGNLPVVSILGILTGAFVFSLALSTAVGFNPGRTHRPVEDTIVGFGASFLLAAFLLVLLRRIDAQMEWGTRLGIIALSAAPMSLGFALGNSLAPAEGGRLEEGSSGGFGDLLAAAGGALVLVFNIAPTEEPVLLAAELDRIRLIGIVLMSLLLSYLMVFYAEFGGRHIRRQAGNPINTPLLETLLAYLVSLTIAGGLLWAFGEMTGFDGPSISKAVVLALPAALGAAVGRLAV